MENIYLLLLNHPILQSEVAPHSCTHRLDVHFSCFHQELKPKHIQGYHICGLKWQWTRIHVWSCFSVISYTCPIETNRITYSFVSHVFAKFIISIGWCFDKGNCDFTFGLGLYCMHTIVPKSCKSYAYMYTYHPIFDKCFTEFFGDYFCHCISVTWQWWNWSEIVFLNYFNAAQ